MRRVNPYQVAAWKLMRYPFRFFLDPQVHGEPHIARALDMLRDKKTGLVIAANHISALDPFFICAVMPFPLLKEMGEITFLAKKQLFDRPFKRWAMERLGAVDVRQRSTLKRTIGQLRRGDVVFLFPEGRVSPDGTMGEDQGALRFFAKFTSFVVLPVLIQGIYGGFRKEWKPVLAGRRRFQVRFGEPVCIERGRHESLDAMAMIRRLEPCAPVRDVLCRAA
ncbi:1-acyl-sn-glycerol-3-phosphate acyltransferases [Desulfacinum hydrothermale DSM 13146]|uniref:1-acyl-sn-glycerol-3-phosphate acyltransferases n=1 Tax=Desulfacinum hydrothermale DSM 13146 TaxID=1121390 RepID=A0A1W1WYF3_9BACT|nr:lysophospholipid acyltransferase family protein [Desulfacinum hydrothermale]SMC16647.1 1-acyl-sn-glycerol-3-phosphate acyltransferases [Desulfacinum hydrothermale DSM 13146]